VSAPLSPLGRGNGEGTHPFLCLRTFPSFIKRGWGDFKSPSIPLFQRGNCGGDPFTKGDFVAPQGKGHEVE